MSDAFGPPVEGRWLVLRPPGHARYAFDLIAVDKSSDRISRRRQAVVLAGLTNVDDIVGWSLPVLAPLAGEVAAAHDGERDRRRLIPAVDIPANFLVRPLRHRGRVEKMAGNHVVLSTSAGHILMAHLKQGSVAVCQGQKVAAGDQIGLVGNSGNSLGPHLHIQLMDAPDPKIAATLPFQMRRFRQFGRDGSSLQLGAPLPARATRVDFSG
jgi:murein DD-endopeptidase MepM/ murein hydrolase activator NlpD